MADARLSISISDDSPGDKTGGSGAGGGASAADDWRRITDALNRAADNLARKTADRGSAGSVGGGGSPRRPAGEGPFGGKYFSALDADAQRKAALNGRPADVSDAEWRAFGARSASAGKGSAAASLAADGMRKKREAADAAAQQAAADAEAKGEENRKELTRIGVGAAAGYTAATAIRGGGAAAAGLAAAGGAAGGAIGYRFGGKAGAAYGAQVGQAVGAKAGSALDSPADKAAGYAGKVARGDATGLVKDVAGDAGTAISAVGAALGPAGLPIMAFGQGVKIAGEAVAKLKETVDVFAARGRELGGYSSQIAGAAANQDVTRLLTDIREGQMLGDKYAKLIDAQTRFEETLKAGLLPLKGMLLDKLPGWLDIALDVLVKMLECLDKMVPGPTIAGEMLSEMKKMRAAFEGGDLPGADAIFREWLKPMRAVEIDGAAAAPGPAPFGLPPIRP